MGRPSRARVERDVQAVDDEERVRDGGAVDEPLDAATRMDADHRPRFSSDWC